jgi:hypothetical protein
LIEEGAAMAGINLFSDYEIKSGHKRLSLGLEYQRSGMRCLNFIEVSVMRQLKHQYY